MSRDRSCEVGEIVSFGGGTEFNKNSMRIGALNCDWTIGSHRKIYHQKTRSISGPYDGRTVMMCYFSLNGETPSRTRSQTMSEEVTLLISDLVDKRDLCTQ
jgi:hypothetical protein